MKIFCVIALVILATAAQAEDKMKFNVISEDLPKVIETYSKVSGQKFIVDSTVRGKITLLNPAEITVTEAFEQLSLALALNGFAISKHGDVMVIRNARSAQRDYMEVGTEKPSLKPERMYTWIYALKNISARELMYSMRMWTSSYGEVTVNDGANQIIITDFTSSLNRVADVLKELDKKVDPAIEKLALMSKKIREQDRDKKLKNSKEEKIIEKTENKTESKTDHKTEN